MSDRCYDKISRHGLTEVYRAAQDGDRPAAHIIFVHGLFGHPEKTWTGTTKSSKTAQQGPSARSSRSAHAQEMIEKEEGRMAKDTTSGFPYVFWPAELLPKVVPNAKIWTWGYDADIDGFWSSASQNTVSQHATNLLSDVADLLETKECNLPIMFVVHSLGGLIVKAAMNMSCGARGNRFKVVIPAVHGVMFLGTPHRGSKSASIGRMAYQITKAAARRPNKKLLQALERNSDTLDQINDSFLQTLEDHNNIAISSFREEKETRKFLFFSTVVVEADSARIGLAREELNSIPANHRHMAKLSSSEDIGFKRVSAQIRRWIQSLPISVDDKDNQEYIDCVRSLDSSATKARLKNVAASHKETLQWLFDSDVVDFSSWLQDSDNSSSSIYWIQGKPGSGKSTLMKFAMMDSRLSDLLQTPEHLPYVICGFFFHDRGTMMQKSMSGMLQELLHSILVKFPALRHFVHPTYIALVEAQKTRLPTWDVESLQQGFEAIISQRQIKTRLCLFLDALDEHHGDNERLASLMKKLIALADGNFVKIKLCLASRPWDTFVTSFSRCPGFKIHDHTYNDIRAYTLSEFRQSSAAGAENSSSGDARSAKLEALAVQVTEKAHGVLYGIEPGHAEEAYVMLQIGLCAISPLLLETFVNVSSFSVWKKVPGRGEESMDDMTQRVISRSGGLLEVIEVAPMDMIVSGRCGRDSLGRQVVIGVDTASEEESAEEPKPNFAYITHRVQFIHQTVKEYVQTRKDNFGLNRTKNGGSGFHYILAAAVRYGQPWADEIGLDLFEYARLANLDKNVESQYDLWSSLDHLVLPSGRYCNYRVDWWVEQKEIEFYKSLLLKHSSHLKVMYMSLAAGLFEYVEHGLRSSVLKSDSYLDGLLHVGTIGPSITSIQTPRREILNFLVQQGYSIDGIITSWISEIPPAASPLALIIRTKGQFDQDEKERVSAIATLLDHGANPNNDLHFIYGGRELYREDNLKDFVHGESLFFQCIRQESAEVVRLFGQYGATLPREMIVPARTLWKMVSMPSAVLEEVIKILQRNYPDVDFDEKWHWLEAEETSQVGDYFCENGSSAAAPIFGAIAAMSVGVSRAFHHSAVR